VGSGAVDAASPDRCRLARDDALTVGRQPLGWCGRAASAVSWIGGYPIVFTRFSAAVFAFVFQGLLQAVAPVAEAKVLKEPVTWEKLRDHIAQYDLKTRAQIIEALPPRMRYNPQYVIRSNSTAAGKVDPDNPRMVFSDETTGFTLTISSSGTDPDAGFVEVGSPTHDHEVAHPKAIQTAEHSNASVKFIEDPYRAFKNHPKKNCRSCHTDKFKYLWPGNYRIWPGVLGEKHQRPFAIEEPEILERIRSHPLAERNRVFNVMIVDLHRKRAEYEIASSSKFPLYREYLNRSKRFVPTQGKLSEIVEAMTDEDFIAAVPAHRREEFRTGIQSILEETMKKSDAFDASIVAMDGEALGSIPETPRKFVYSPDIKYSLLKFASEDMGFNPQDWFWTNSSKMTYPNDGDGGLFDKMNWTPPRPLPAPLANFRRCLGNVFDLLRFQR
jgi:hypothetical protein